MKLNIGQINQHVKQRGKAQGTPRRKGNAPRSWSYNDKHARLYTGPVRVVRNA